MRNILFFLLILIMTASCAPGLTPEETVNRILDLVEREDYSSLDTLAPFITELDPGERNSLREGLLPFARGNPYREVKRQGFRRCSLVLYTRERESKSLIMTLEKNKGAWILSENVSYTQKIGFIPAEK